MKTRSFVWLLLAFVWGCSSPGGTGNGESVKSKFKTIQIQTREGKQLLLSDFLLGFDAGKPVVMVTWFNDCDGCRKVIEKLIAEKEKNHSFELVAFNIDKVGKKGSVATQKEYEKMKQNTRWNCKMIYNPTGSYAHEFLEDTPTNTETFIILDGKVRYARINSNYISYSDQGVMIKAALASQKAPVHSQFFHENGEPAVSYGFENFKRAGTWTAHYKNGQLKYVVTFVDGRKEGMQKFYFDNGQLRAAGKYLAGKKEGLWKFYYRSGQVEYVANLRKDHLDGTRKSYYENGTLASLTQFKDGKKNGTYKSYFSNGQMQQVGKFRNDKEEGLWKTYYRNGKIESTGQFVEGKKSGLWKDYFDNGQLKMAGIYSQGKPDGEWKIYHDNGQLYQVRLWENGKYMDIISTFDGRGKPLKKGTLVNGNGTVISYNKNGRFIAINNYINGKKEKDYASNLLLKKINRLAEKTTRKPLKPYSGTTTIRFRSYPRSMAKRIDSVYYIILPLDVPKEKSILLLMKNVSSWRVFTSDDLNTASNYHLYNLKKSHFVYVNGKKLHLSQLKNLIVQGGNSDLEMASLQGKKCYLSIEMKADKYKKARKETWPFYVGYYAFADEQGVKKFKQKLHRLE